MQNKEIETHLFNLAYLAYKTDSRSKTLWKEIRDYIEQLENNKKINK